MKLKYLSKALYWLAIIALVSVATLLAITSLPLNTGYRLFTVLSGSMEPEIKTGSVVLVKDESDYYIGDIITFKSEEDRNNDNPSFTTTHRLIGIEDDGYQTKGDANDGPDGSLTDPNLVIGKVTLTSPYLGYIVNFAKTGEGLVLLIVVPATLIIYTELLNIKKELKKLITKKKQKPEKDSDEA